MSHPPRRPRRFLAGRPGPKNRIPGQPTDDAELAELALLRAVRLLAEGQSEAAKEAAGEAVYYDPKSPHGFLLLGEALLANGEAPLAVDAFERGLEVLAALGRREEESNVALTGHLGLARAYLILEETERAVPVFAEALRLDPSDSHRVRPLYAASLIEVGRPDEVLRLFRGHETLGFDEHFLCSWASFECGDPAGLDFHLRLALFGNVYLVAALLDEPTPEFGLVHGLEDSTPEAASTFAEQIRSLLLERPKHLEQVAELAGSPQVQLEFQAYLETARELNRVGDPKRRDVLKRRLGDLKNPLRLRATFVPPTHDD